MIELTPFMLSALGVAGVPLVHSIIKETRFTEKSQLIWGGLAAIAFSFVYILDPKFPISFEFLKIEAFPVLFSFGVISFLVGLKIQNNQEGLWTLLLSKRQFGALGIAYLWPLFTNQIPPQLINFPEISSTLDFAISLLIIVNVVTYVIWAIRRHH